MLSPRTEAQSIVIKRGIWPNLVEKMWIIGGRSGVLGNPNDNPAYTTYDWVNTTEIHTFGKNPKYGPELPEWMARFCATKIADHRVMILGGETRDCNYCRHTWIYNFQDTNWGWMPKASAYK